MSMRVFHSIRNKIIAALVAAGVISAVVVGELASQMSKGPTIDAAIASLDDANFVRALGLKAYGDTIDHDLDFVAENPSTLEDIWRLARAFENVNRNAGENVVKAAFVDDNPNDLNARSDLLEAEAAGAYSGAHAQSHPIYVNLMKAVGFYDVFLISPDGTVVYSVTKKDDFGSNLIDGPYSNSGLSRAFAKASKLQPGEIAFDDLAPYAPNKGAPAAFAALPIFSKNAFTSDLEFAGVLAVEVSVEMITQSIFPATEAGLALSYVVGPDNVLRSDLPTIDGSEAGIAEFNLRETDGEQIGTAVGGVPSILSFEDVNFLGANWRVVSEVPLSIAKGPLADMRSNLLLVLVPVILILSAMSVWIGRSLARPITELGQSVSAMAAGNRNQKVPHADRPDEIGKMAVNLERFRGALNDADEERKQTAERESAMAQERAKMLEDLEQGVGGVVAGVTAGNFDRRVDRTFDDAVINGLAQGVNQICEVVGRFVGDFDKAVDALSKKDLTARVGSDYQGRFSDVATNFNAALQSLTHTVEEITGSTAEMTDSVRGVETGASELATRAVSQASSLEETAASMEQIAKSVSSTAENARKASALSSETETWASKGREVVGSAVTAMAEIESSSTKIADIISIIDSIAFQTNLLALNAAVEAARAGDAGKGFAVVASEVRTLAQRSSEAAKDIGDLISASSTKVSDGVRLVNATGDALKDISQAIDGFGDTIEAISKAMDEQQLSTAEVSAAISEMDSLTQQNAGMADSSASAVQVIMSLSDKLAARMDEFNIGQSSIRKARKTLSAGTGSVPLTSQSQSAVVANEVQADEEWQSLAKAASADNLPRQNLAAANGEGEWAEF